MSGWPVILNVANRRIVVIGGGPVALRRVQTLLDAGATAPDITVIAPQVAADLAGLAVRIEQRPYRKGDCDGAFIVVVATDDAALNEAVAREAASGGALINRAEAPDEGTLSVMAHRRRGPVTIAVATNGASAAAAHTLVETLASAVDENWVRLLGVAGEFRAIAQQRIADKALRQAVLKRLTDERAMHVLKSQGETALRHYLLQMMGDTHAE